MGSRIRSRRSPRITIGDIVAYVFKDLSRDRDRIRMGYIIGEIPPYVYQVRGFDGIEYHIHQDFLERINKDEI